MIGNRIQDIVAVDLDCTDRAVMLRVRGSS